MWIKIKTQEGDTLDKIAKRYKNKDPKAILGYAGNKQHAAQLRKGEALPKGTEIWVLDPKGKVYIVKTAKGETILDEKQYKAFKKDVDKKMDQFLERQRLNYNYACDRHDAQLAINKDQWFVSSVVETFNSVPEPASGWKVAKAAYKKLEGVVTSRNYAKFPAEAERCEKAVTKYTNDVLNWIEGIISTAEGTVTVLKGVKEVGKFCGVLAAVTIAAPATLGAAMVVGGASSAGVGLLYDGGENVGLAANGMKTRSAAEIGKRMLYNGITGALAAGILGKVMPMVKGPLVSALCKSSVIKSVALRLGGNIGKTFGGKVFQKEMEIAMQKIVPEMVKKGTIHISVVESRVLLETTSKFLLRAGNGLLHKYLGTRKGLDLIEAAVLDWIKGAPKELQSKDGKGAGDAAAKAVLKNTKTVDSIFEAIIKENAAEFRKDLQAVLQEHVKREAKKMKAA